MSASRYLVAKYMPDLWRMEPRNIGVVVWSPGGVAARFLGERPEGTGEVDGRTLPSLINSISAYKQWIHFWRTALDRPEASPLPGGLAVPRQSPEFLSILRETGRGNYVLVDGGEVLDAVTAESLPDLVDYLFHQLVEAPASPEPRDPTLEDVCAELILESGLADSPLFETGYEIECPVSRTREAVRERFEFSYALKKGAILGLYHRVPLPAKQKRNVAKNVDASAWMFDRVLKAKLVRRKQCAALVYVTAEQQADPDISRSLGVLGSVTRVLNLARPEPARREFQALAAGAKG